MVWDDNIERKRLWVFLSPFCESKASYRNESCPIGVYVIKVRYVQLLVTGSVWGSWVDSSACSHPRFLLPKKSLLQVFSASAALLTGTAVILRRVDLGGCSKIKAV